jgi:uncharacterized repeat protein (TIGR02543 family)
MNNNTIKRIICLVIALMMIMPAMPNSYVSAESNGNEKGNSSSPNENIAGTTTGSAINFKINVDLYNWSGSNEKFVENFTKTFEIKDYDFDKGITLTYDDLLDYGLMTKYNIISSKDSKNSMYTENSKLKSIDIPAKFEGIYEVNYEIHLKDGGSVLWEVVFEDWDHDVLKTQWIVDGKNATPPAKPERVGYTFAGWDGNYIKVTQNETITATYDINVYTVTFVDYDNTVIKTQQVSYKGDATLPADPSRDGGYTFVGWNGNYTDITKNETVTATYIKNTDTQAAYKVEYYYQNVTGDGYTLSNESFYKPGNVGEPATAPVNEKDGFTENISHQNRLASGNITADGKLVLRLFYDRNLFTVNFVSDGEIISSQQVRYEGSATLPTNPVKSNYTFTGWSGKYTNVTQNETVKATFAPVDETEYIVEHYLQQVNGTYPNVPKDKVSGKGAAGTKANAEVKEYPGYTLDQTTSVLSGNISKDEVLVLKLFYKANPYNVNYKSNETAETSSDVSNPYIVGEKVTVLGSLFARTDYRFDGWVSGPELNNTLYIEGKTFDMPAGDVTLYAQWTYIGSNEEDEEDEEDENNNDNDDDDDYTDITEIAVPLADLEKSDHFAYVIGYPEGDVRPLNNITREEVAMIFYRLLTDESRNNLLSDTNSFTDLENSGWSNRAISTLYNAGILKGYPDGTFRPTEPVTRAEFATIAAKFDKLELGSASKFTDIPGHWAEKYITSSEIKGWIKGYNDLTFKPEQDITRAETMTLINNVLARIVPEENIHPEALSWTDIESSEWYYEAVMEATNSHDYLFEEDGDELWTGLKANKVWP